MSYCRWSSDNWKSDVYCYEDVAGGWTTHVASAKPVGDIPPQPDWALLNTDPERWQRENAAVLAFLETAETKAIGLPSDGKTFNDATLTDFKARLRSLQAEGYHVPAHVFDDIDAEMRAAP